VLSTSCSSWLALFYMHAFAVRQKKNDIIPRSAYIPNRD
jgi:hypothetical protein